MGRTFSGAINLYKLLTHTPCIPVDRYPVHYAANDDYRLISRRPLGRWSRRNSLTSRAPCQRRSNSTHEEEISGTSKEKTVEIPLINVIRYFCSQDIYNELICIV